MITRTPKVELVYLDARGSTGAVTVHFPIGTTVIEALDATNALGASIASLTGCTLVKARIKFTLFEDSVGIPDEGASITERGVFYFDTTGGNPIALIEIPGIKDSAFLSTGFGAGFIIDLANSDVITFVSAVIAMNACNVFVDTVTGVNVAYLQSRV